MVYCVNDIIRVTELALEYFGSVVYGEGDDYSNGAMDSDRNSCLSLMLMLVCKTACVSSRESLTAIVKFLNCYIECKNLSNIEKCTLVYLTTFITSDSPNKQSMLKQIETKFQIPSTIQPQFKLTNSNEIDEFLWNKVTFRYLLAHNRFSQLQLSNLLSRIEGKSDDLDTLSALVTFLSNPATKTTTDFFRREGKKEQLNKLLSILKVNFYSFNTAVVLKTTEVFMCFDWSEKESDEANPNCGDHVQRLLQYFYQILSMPDSLETMREKLLLCEQLQWKKVSKAAENCFNANLMSDNELSEICFSFLLSLCFQRFVPLQKGLADVLNTYKSKSNVMASVLNCVLDRLFFNSEYSVSIAVASLNDENCEELQCSLFNLVHEGENSCLLEQRESLLKAFKMHTMLAEVAVASVKNCFFHFLMRDFLNTTSLVKKSKLHQILQNVVDTGSSDYVPVCLKPGQSHIPTLLSFFQLLTSLSDRKEVREDATLLALLFEMLKSNRAFLQKAALELLLSFKWPSLQPYSDFLQLLTSEKTIKKALVELKLSTENCIINENHRPDVLKILIPFLLGRLFNSSWLANVDERFRCIFQYIRFLHDEEKESFVEKAFEDFSQLITEGQLPSLDLSNFGYSLVTRFLLIFQQLIRNMKQLSFSNVINQFGRCVMNICLYLERTKPNWQKRHMTKNKQRFKLAMVCFLDYLDMIEDDYLTECDIVSVCDTLIKPVLVLKPSMSYTNVTLSVHFKLLKCLASNSVYRKFLDLEVDSRNKRSILECLGQYLDNDANSQLQSFVVGIFASLIPSENQTDDVSTEQKDFDDLGAKLLTKSSPFIIKFLQTTLLSDRFKKSTPIFRLHLLKLLGFVVKDIKCPNESLALAKTLVEYVSKKRKMLPAEIGSDITSLIVALLKNCENPVSVLFKLSSNFSENLPTQIRNNLCKVYTLVSKEFEEVLLGLNSWNSRFVEEPDFALRFESFGKIPDILRSLSPEVCVIAIATLFKNCCYFIEHVEDFAIRDRSVETIKFMINNFSLNLKLVHLIKCHLSHLLKSNLQDPVLINVLCVLKCLVENCHEMDSNLKELNILQTHNTDVIADLAQLQMTKRCRALVKISSLVQKNNFSLSTSDLFLVPLAWIPIKRFSEVSDPNLINASIDLLKSCANKLKLSDLIKLAEQCLALVKRNEEDPKVPCRLLAAILTTFATNDNVLASSQAPNGCQNVNSTINSFANKTLHLLTSQKVSEGELFDKEESIAIIAKLPLHIGLFNVARNLPTRQQGFHVKKLLLSLCGFLRSRDKSVRHATRGVLFQILPLLTKEYLNYLLKDLFLLLDRGYLRHVLVFTLFRLLTEAKCIFSAGDISVENMNAIAAFLIRDLFGLGAEQRTSAKYVSKTEEARKGYAIPAYGLLGYFCTEDVLTEMLKHPRDGLEEKETSQTKTIVSDILNRFCTELLLNKKLSVLQHLKFAQSVCNGNLQNLLAKQNELENQTRTRDVRLRPEDYRLLDPVPIRAVDRKPNIITFSYHHVFLQFGLQLLLKLTSKLENLPVACKAEVYIVLNQLVPLVMKGMKSSYVPILTQSIRCVKEFVTLQLEGVLTTSNFDSLIKINKKYCRGSAISTETQELVPVVSNCIKLFLASECLPVSEEQLTVILAHVEEDLSDKNKVKSALGLLKPVIGRRLNHINVSEVMNTVSKIMIQSPSLSNRINCRNIYLEYLIGYAQEKAEKSLDFVLAQMVHYETQTGRESAIEMLILFVTKINTKFLSTIAEKLFYPLCLTLVNDIIDNCRRLARVCLSRVANGVDDAVFRDFLKYSFKWMKKYDDLSLLKVGFLVCEILLENWRPLIFQDKLGSIFELATNAIDHCDAKQTCFVPGIQSKTETHTSSKVEVVTTRSIDYTLCAIFKLLEKALQKSDLTSHNLHHFRTLLPDAFQKVIDFMVYPHEWVQALCCQIMASIFSLFPPALFAESHFMEIISSGRGKDAGFEKTLAEILKNIVDALFANLSHIDCSKEVMDISLKNLVYLTLVFSTKQFSPNVERRGLSVLLPEVIEKVCNLALKESKFNSKVYSKRTFVFHYQQLVLQSPQFVQCCCKLKEDGIKHLLLPVVRELTSKTPSQGTDDKEVVEFTQLYHDTYQRFEKAFKDIKETSTQTDFVSHYYTVVMGELRERRMNRKAVKRREAVINPVSSAAKKTEQNMKTRVNRKRKLAETKGKIPKKKGKLGSKRINSEEMLVEDLI